VNGASDGRDVVPFDPELDDAPRLGRKSLKGFPHLDAKLDEWPLLRCRDGPHQALGQFAFQDPPDVSPSGTLPNSIYD
jgi:hypothetical protein